MNKDNLYALIIGAGPSGLALAYELIKLNSKVKPIIIEKLPTVGGLSRTVYDGKSGIDIGGHRLFTKNKYVETIWKEFLPVQNAAAYDDLLARRNITYPKCGVDPNMVDDVLLIRKRFSSVIKDNKRYKYPIRFDINMLKNLGVFLFIKALFSHIYSLFFKRKKRNIENFLINKFGLYLYNIFFKEQSAKMWGMSPSEIVSEWPKGKFQKFLFTISPLWEDEYYYPKFGCSQLWDKMAQYITDNGGKILLNCEFEGFKTNENKILSAKVKTKDEILEIPADYFISSIPISDLIKAIDAPYDIKQYALNLPYRDYILVSFFVNKFNLKNNTKFAVVNDTSPDNWIYLQNKGTLASRLQIMNNWSPYLIEDFKNNYIISLEYFCSQNDDLWKMSDNEITKFAFSECEKYGFFEKDNIFKTKVIRELKAYPIYSGSYLNIDKVKQFLNTIDNLRLIGRNGTHQYINMDSAMVCGINIAREINEGIKNGKKMS